jgi:hypothetical protein
MTTEQFADLLTELKAIKLVLITASVLIAASVGMAAFRTYRYVKHFVTERFDDLFRQEGQDGPTTFKSAGTKPCKPSRRPRGSAPSGRGQ